MNRDTFLYRFSSIVMHQGKVMHAINRYASGLNPIAALRLRCRISWIYAVHAWSPEEYFLYGYESLTPAERKDFVPSYPWDLFVRSTLTQKIMESNTDKWKVYQMFKEYYHRNMCRIAPASEGVSVDDIYRDFIECFTINGQLVQSVIIKPFGKESGVGVKVLNLEDYDTKEAFAKLLHQYSGGATVEELIVQDPALAQFHPQSVNTLRINTIRFSDKVHPFLPLFRMGRGDLNIDNFHGGGIGACVDIHTGVSEAAQTLDLEKFEKHPDTGVMIKGFAIPRWQEMLDMTCRAALKYDVGTIIGWDLALTEKGWVLVELNKYPGIPLIQRHFHDEFEYIRAQYKQSMNK